MSVASFYLPTTCDIHRPFGSASLVASDIPCRLTADFRNSRHAEDIPDWTHYLILDSSVDVRDGVTRLAGSNVLTYVDGDEVHIPRAPLRRATSSSGSKPPTRALRTNTNGCF